MKNKCFFQNTAKFISACIAAIILMGAYTVYPKNLGMSSDNADFLSKVRYIISKEETKFFKNLPDDKRDEFIQQFWDIRDPDPGTPENEFKDEYFKRIDETNRLFTAGKEGWLTDRGKTYILLGPPHYMENFPFGGNPINNLSRNPYTIWHYTEFYLVFIDNKNDGDFQVQYTNLDNLAEIQGAFQRAKQDLKYLDKKLGYDFSLKRNKQKINSLLFSIDISSMTFSADGDNMVAKLDIQLKLKNSAFEDIWSYSDTHTARFAKNDANIPKKISVEIPLGSDVKKGEYFCFTSLNRGDGKDKMFLNKMIKVK